MKREHIIIALLVIILCVGFYYFVLKKDPPSSNSEVEKKIDLIERKIDSLSLKRDSIQSIIDTSRVKIIEIHEEYSKTHTNIVYQPVDSDYVQFAKYCSDNQGLLNPNYTTTAEDN
jgi:hypothetical protein